MILELTGVGALDRPMARVVNARRHLIRQQMPVSLEEFDRKNADVLERLHGFGCMRLGLGLKLGSGSWSRAQRQPQDSVLMVILNQRIECCFTRAIADRDN